MAGAAARAGASALEQLRAVLRLYGPTGTAPGWMVWMDGWSEALHNDAMRDVIQAHGTRWHGALTDLVRSAQEEGSLTGQDGGAVARGLLDTLDGLSIRRVLDAVSGRMTWQEVELAARQCIDELLEDLAPAR